MSFTTKHYSSGSTEGGNIGSGNSNDSSGTLRYEQVKDVNELREKNIAFEKKVADLELEIQNLKGKNKKIKKRNENFKIKVETLKNEVNDLAGSKRCFKKLWDDKRRLVKLIKDMIEAEEDVPFHNVDGSPSMDELLAKKNRVLGTIKDMIVGHEDGPSSGAGAGGLSS